VKAHLMFRDADFTPRAEKSADRDALIKDLQLQPLLDAMSGGDPVIAGAADAALFSAVPDAGTRAYRRDILQDCLKNPAVARKLYALAAETFERRRKERLWLSTFFLSGLIFSAVNLLEMLSDMLRKLRDLANKSARGFESEGFTQFFAMLRKELSDEYLAEVAALLNELKFRDGVLVSARLGEGSRGTEYVLRHTPRVRYRDWAKAPSYTVGARDEMGGGDLSQRSARAVNLSANVLARATDHILAFFSMLRGETAFYVGCLNLRERLQALDVPVCFPQAWPDNENRRAFTGLRELSLALQLGRECIGNDLAETGSALYVITGTNQGGKTTYLRAVGQAHLMAGCGMFVAAQACILPGSGVVFTHFAREEDAQMIRGRLDEELYRMDGIVSRIKPGDLLLLNESFSSTYETEGGMIGVQIASALAETGVTVFAVTNSFTFANSLYLTRRPEYLFLLAQRLDSGSRTYRIIPGPPQKSGYGEDVYREVFGQSPPASFVLPSGRQRPDT
jgi:hypothetical protein